MDVGVLREIYGEEYPAAVTVDGVRMPLEREDRFSRRYLAKDLKVAAEVSRFMDGTATMTFAQPRDEWPSWSETERLEFCNACSGLSGQSDFADMLRSIMRSSTPRHWSSVALSVAHHLPQGEAFAVLLNALGTASRMRDARILYVIVRDEQGHVAHAAIGCAMVEADLTIFALRKRIEPLTSFYADSPAQAEEAKRTLGELGDVEFDDRDFDPQWFEPMQGIATIDGLLEHGRKGKDLLSEPVRGELGLLRRTLAEARRRSCQFYRVEVDGNEGLEFAGVEFTA